MQKYDYREVLEKGSASWKEWRRQNLIDEIRKADLSGMNLNDFDFRGMDLDEIDLRKASLQRADFRDSDLREADFRDADVSDADFRKANLHKADFRGADCSRTDFRGADTTRTQFDTHVKRTARFDKDVPAITGPFPDLNGICESEDLVFVLMPFNSTWSESMWQEHVRPVVTGIESLTCVRANDLCGQDVLHDICVSIAKAKIVIADLTGHNPNVFYELGIAHCRNKRVLLLIQEGNTIPFDLVRFRHIIYKTNEHGLCEFDTMLRKSILESLDQARNEPTFRSP